MPLEPLKYYGCLIYGNEIFEQWKYAGVNSAPVHLRKLLYCGAVAGPNGNDAFEFFLEKYMAEADAAHRTVLILALACSKSRAQLKRLLVLAEDSQSGIELYGRLNVLKRMATEIAGRDLAIEYIQNNLIGTLVTPELYDAVIFELSFHVHRVSVITKLENHVQMNEVVLRDVLSSIEESLIRMRSNAEWMKSVGNRGFTWMKSTFNE